MTLISSALIHNRIKNLEAFKSFGYSVKQLKLTLLQRTIDSFTFEILLKLNDEVQMEA